MLNKPYIHHIDVKIMNNVSKVATGLTSLYWTVLIRYVHLGVDMNVANERLLFTINVLNS
jgi:hypothetical protein